MCFKPLLQNSINLLAVHNHINFYDFSRSLCNEKLHAENVAKIVLGSVGNFLASLGFPGPTVKVVKKDLSMETPADVMVNLYNYNGRSNQMHVHFRDYRD